MRKVTVILILVLLVSGSGIIAGEVKKYSPEKLKEDFRYLYKSLKLSHYDLYANTGSESYDAAYKRILMSIDRPMSLLEATRLFQPFVALSKMGHCTVVFPFKRTYGAYIGKGGKLFPLDVVVLRGRVFVKSNFSNKRDIKEGSEILSINGKSAKEILSDMHSFLGGETGVLKNTIMEMYSLPRLLWLMGNVSEEYVVKVKEKAGRVYTVKLPAVFAGEFEQLYGKKEPMFHNSREFRFIGKIAYMKPGPFMNLKSDNNTSDTKTFEADEFVKFIDSAFSKIAEKGSDSLIIDLRNNTGGSNTFSDKLVAYIADKPFAFCSGYSIRTSKISKDVWKKIKDPDLKDLREKILSYKDGEKFEHSFSKEFPVSEKRRFKGRVYVLINRYSYSQATLTAALIQDYKFGKLVGEATADLPTNHGSVHQFTLLNTGLAVLYPKALIVRPNRSLKASGTVPDIEVADDPFSPEDEILNHTLKLINKKKK